MTRQLVIDRPEGPLAIEYRAVAGPSDGPVMVFLHEGLGSVAQWRDVPDRLCAAAGCRGLVYSRPGYGRSTPRPAGVRWPVRFMHDQAALLPGVLSALGLGDPVWLLGHSDGGSIALIAAAQQPALVAGAIVLAPHIFVEEVTLARIRAARVDYLAGGLKAALGRYHDDPDSAFFGWNDIWLDPAFRAWTLADLLGRIRCPLLAVQGADDPYGTMAQLDGIAHRVPQAELLKLVSCGHAPQRDQPDRLLAEVARFVGRHRAICAPSPPC